MVKSGILGGRKHIPGNGQLVMAQGLGVTVPRWGLAGPQFWVTTCPGLPVTEGYGASRTRTVQEEVVTCNFRCFCSLDACGPWRKHSWEDQVSAHAGRSAWLWPQGLVERAGPAVRALGADTHFSLTLVKGLRPLA